MDAEVKAAIIEVAGLWSIEVAKGLHEHKKFLPTTLISNFEWAYEQISAIITKAPNP